MSTVLDNPQHKRSDRGSAEEVTCCTKNSSMTDLYEETPTTTGDENITPSEEEPSLREIKNLLISIQASVSEVQYPVSLKRTMILRKN